MHEGTPKKNWYAQRYFDGHFTYLPIDDGLTERSAWMSRKSMGCGKMWAFPMYVYIGRKEKVHGGWDVFHE